MATYHAENKEQLLRYLQTRKDEDKPDHWISGSSSYKAIVEMLEKLTGQDRIQKHQVETKSEVTFLGASAEDVKKLTESPTGVHDLIKGLIGNGSK
jgi:hypothetical protein